MACFHPNHPATNARTRCTATRSFRTPKQGQEVIRFLKFWALEGMQAPSKEAHQAIRTPPGNLPSMEELDAQAPPDYT
eukprot:5287997-Alexandrium_andersonii.AAC.1